MFVAINIDQEIKQHIVDIQEKIKSFNDAVLKMKSVERKNLHISVKFLGDLNSIEIEKIWLALQKISFRYQPFIIKLAKKIEVFPNFKRPRVIWVGLEEGYNQLREIHGAIEQELREEDFYQTDKKYTAHITIGRVKFLKYPNKLAELIKKLEVEGFSQTIHSIELMESNLTPKGPIYTVKSQFPLL